MDVGKTAFGVVGVVIAVIMVATLGIPVMDDVSKVPEERSNVAYTDLYSEVQSITVTSASSAVTIDGEAYTPSSGMRLIVMSPSFTLFSSGTTYYWSGMTSTSAMTGTLGEAWSFQLSGGNWSFNDGTTTHTGEADIAFALDEAGDKALMPNGTVAYADATSDVYIAYALLTGGVVETVFAEIETLSSESQSVDVFYSDRVTPARLTAVWTEKQEDGAYAISESSIAITDTFTVYPSILVDLEYTAMVPDDGSVRSTLIGVVITLLTIVPVMMAVRMIGGDN